MSSLRQPNRTPERLVLLVAATASVAYVGAGIALFVTSETYGLLPESGMLRYGMGALLIIYGLFRAFRAYQRFKEEF